LSMSGSVNHENDCEGSNIQHETCEMPSCDCEFFTKQLKKEKWTKICVYFQLYLAGANGASFQSATRTTKRFATENAF
jgi:hypothetical protein